MLMRLMRIVVALLTVATAVAFTVVFTRVNILSDKTIPVISVDGEKIDVSVNATDEDLLKGVTAFDEKDGDITDRIIVESISKFSKTGYCKVVYVVSDYDNHVSIATRQIHYTDYTPPKFTLRIPLVFSNYGTVNIVGKIGAKDVLDGDISQNVILYSPDFEADKVGSYTLIATVMNSKGDTAELKLPVTVEKTTRETPQIELSDYLVYVKRGQNVNWKKFIRETTNFEGLIEDLDVSVSTDFNKNKPGTYVVDYYTTDERGAKGHTALIAIVQ